MCWSFEAILVSYGFKLVANMLYINSPNTIAYYVVKLYLFYQWCVFMVYTQANTKIAKMS